MDVSFDHRVSGRGEGAADPFSCAESPFSQDVEVEEGQQVAGEPAVKLTGVLDTSAMVEGMLSQFGPLVGGGHVEDRPQEVHNA